MSIRSVMLGVVFGLLIVSTTHFNDQIIRQTFITGNHLPPIVFGLVLLLLLVGNPLLKLVGERWMFSAGEIATVLALGLIVCAWPGSNMLRIFTHLVAVPAQQRQVQPGWQSASVFAYIPGGPPYVAEGYVNDWPVLLDTLRSSDAEVIVAIRARLRPELLRRLDAPDVGGGYSAGDRRETLRQMNEALSGTRLIASSPPDTATVMDRVTAHRAALELAMPGVFKPAPQGAGVLLNEGEPVGVETSPLFVPAADPGGWPSPGLVDWAMWWPTLRLWIGLAVLLGVATLLMIVVVHPQWSQRELLPYPTVRFVQEAVTRTPGRAWPDVISSRVFWIGAGGVMVLHLINGLHVWFDQLPDIPRDLNFSAMLRIFPMAERAYGWQGVFHPTIYFTVIGFGYFVNTRISFSLGFAVIAWVVISAVLAGSGILLTNNRFDPEAVGPAMRFGSYLGLTLMVLYLGKWYYLGVARAAIGLPRGMGVTGYAVWAMRGLVLAVGGSVWLLVSYGGVGYVLAAVLVGSVLMIGLVLARVNAETGLFYAQPDFVPAIVLAGLLGYEGIGIEALVVLTLASLVLVADPREALGAYAVNALELKHRLGKASPARSVWTLGPTMVGGLLVGVVVTLTLQHHYGLSDNGWAWGLPRSTITQTTNAVNYLDSIGRLGELTGISELHQLSQAQPMPRVIALVTLGALLVLGCAAARLRLPWWPLHPVIFIVWGTYPAYHFAFSFLLASLIKASIIRLGGTNSYHAAKPLMIGLITAELLAVLLWSVVGLAYYLATGETPETYRIFPG